MAILKNFEAKLGVGVSVEMVVMDCCVCGVIYALSAHMRNEREENGGSWHCPNGHKLSYTKSQVQREREKREATERLLRQTESRAERLSDQVGLERKRTASYKGQVTRIKNRVANGVCPCCNRTFANLQRHMANQHPDFRADDAAVS